MKRASMVRSWSANICLCRHAVSGYFASERGKPASGHIEKLRFPFKRLKKRPIGAGHEGLPAKLIKDAEECGAASRIEMRGDFIEQKYGCHAGKLRRQPRMSKHQTDQQGLLLARGTKCGRHRLGPMLDDQIGAMRPFERAARRPVACAPIAQGAAEILFKIERRLDTDSLLQRSFQKAVSLGKRS